MINRRRALGGLGAGRWAQRSGRRQSACMSYHHDMRLDAEIGDLGAGSNTCEEGAEREGGGARHLAGRARVRAVTYSSIADAVGRVRVLREPCPCAAPSSVSSSRPPMRERRGEYRKRANRPRPPLEDAASSHSRTHRGSSGAPAARPRCRREVLVRGRRHERVLGR